MKRIGEILIEHGWVQPAALERALATQRAAGQRVCSLLIARGELDPDHAARALGEQHAVAAVLQKHLARREEVLASRLPASLARACIALPIGRMGSGEVIVCVRDPSPALPAQLARAMNERIVVAVAPAQQLEALVAATYGPADADEIDVDLDTGPVPAIDIELDGDPADSLEDLTELELVELDDQGVSKDPSQSESFQPGPSRGVLARTVSVGLKLELDEADDDPFPELDLALSRMTSPTASTIGELDEIELPEPPSSRGREALAELAMESLASSLGTRARTTSAPPPASEPPVPEIREDTGPALAPPPAPPPAPPLAIPFVPPLMRPIPAASGPLDRAAATAPRAQMTRRPPGPPAIPPLPSIPRPGALDVGEITRAPTHDAAADAVMKVAAERWRSGLLFELVAGSAVGRRGFGPELSDDLAQWIVLSLAETSLVQAAAEARTAVTRVTAESDVESDAEERVLRLVGTPALAIASVADEVPRYVLVVGEPIGDGSVSILEQLATALATTCSRLRGR